MGEQITPTPLTTVLLLRSIPSNNLELDCGWKLSNPVSNQIGVDTQKKLLREKKDCV
jgi:hypothetical protein